MNQDRSLLSIVCEWLCIGAIFLLAVSVFSAIGVRLTKKARTFEAISNLGTLGASLERCFLSQGAYGACQGGFFWENHWMLDVENPNKDPDARFEYGIWADHFDWIIAARPKYQEKGGLAADEFLAMSTYSNGKLIFCGFHEDDEMCDDLRFILPERKETNREK